MTRAASRSPGWKGPLKLVVVAICFALIARRLDGAALRDTLRNPRWEYLALATGMIWCEPVIAAIKWRLLIGLGRGAVPPLGLLIRTLFTSNFLSLMAPTALSADALRLWMLRRRGYRVAHTMSALLTDRFLGLAMLLLAALAGWAYARSMSPDMPGLRAIPAFCLLGLIAIAAAFSRIWLRLLEALRARLLWRRMEARHPAWARRRVRIEELLGELLRGMQDCRARPAGLAKAAGWNLAIQLLRVLQAWALFRVLGHPAPFLHTLTFVPLIVIVSMLPVSFYGLGIKEGAFAYLFGQVGVPHEISVSVSLLTYPLILSALLPGLWFFLRDRDWPPSTEETSSQ